MQTTGVFIRDTPGVSVSKKKEQEKVYRGKCMELLSDVALLKAAQLTKVLDELKEKITGIYEGTGTIPGSPNVPKDQSESENKFGEIMALLDKHQLKFNIHKDAKTLMEAIEKRLQKLINQLKILGETLSQKYINLKFLRSLPIEWRTHTLIWRNKTDLEEQSLDDLFNSLKIYETEVKGSSSASTFTQNIAFVSFSNTDSTNEPVCTAASVSTVSAKIPVSALLNVDTLINIVIYLFFASQSISPHLDNDDLKQTDADDLEEMDIKWQMAMLTSVTTAIGKDTLQGMSPKDTRRNGAAEPQRRNVPVETSTSNTLVSQCDGVGSYDWSFQAEEEPTNYTLMDFTSSSSSSDNQVVSCSKACTKAYATLQSHYDKLPDDFRKSQFDVISYKTGLESVEARLLVYQQNETLFEEDIKLLKLESDDSLPPSPIYNRYQSGDRYHAVPPPYTGTFMPPKPNLVHNAPDINETVHNAFNVELSPTKPENDLSYTYRPSAPIIEDWLSDSEDESENKIP
uniref:Uncharacterized protein n=1 Tax=Tanacetum cinerariifolium TaxID=118510 RepID=A0A6L2LSF2_TANCI|nr:hypothetical protein [Tanacetum cinerariifolium]